MSYLFVSLTIQLSQLFISICNCLVLSHVLLSKLVTFVYKYYTPHTPYVWNNVLSAAEARSLRKVSCLPISFIGFYTDSCERIHLNVLIHLYRKIPMLLMIKNVYFLPSRFYNQDAVKNSIKHKKNDKAILSHYCSFIRIYRRIFTRFSSSYLCPWYWNVVNIHR